MKVLLAPGHLFKCRWHSFQKIVNAKVEENFQTFQNFQSLELDLSAFKEKQGQGEEQRQTYRIRPETGGRDPLGAFWMAWFWGLKGLLPGTVRKTDRRHRRHICQRTWRFLIQVPYRRPKKILRRRTRTRASGQLVDLRSQKMIKPTFEILVLFASMFKIERHWNCQSFQDVSRSRRRRSPRWGSKRETNGLFLFSILFYGVPDSTMHFGNFRKNHAEGESDCRSDKESTKEISDGMVRPCPFPRMFSRDYQDWRKTHQVSVAKAKAKGKAKAKAKPASPVKKAWFSDLGILSHWVQNLSPIITYNYCRLSFLLPFWIPAFDADSHFGHWGFVGKWIDEILWRRRQRRAWRNKSRGLQIQMLHWFEFCSEVQARQYSLDSFWWSWQWHIAYISVLLHPLHSGFGRRAGRRGRRGWGRRGWRRGAQQAFWEGEKGYNLLVQLW